MKTFSITAGSTSKTKGETCKIGKIRKNNKGKSSKGEHHAIAGKNY